MKKRQHRNGNVTFWAEGRCYAIKFADYDTIDYFIRYEDGRWVACSMGIGAFKYWYYGKSSSLRNTKVYCKVDEFGAEKQEEMIRYINGGVL